MTIQISVLLWTVISFVLFTIILRSLLLNPVLSLLERRTQRIEKVTSKYDTVLNEFSACSDEIAAVFAKRISE